MIDAYAEVCAGRGRFEWTTVRRRVAGNVFLDVAVFADAMKFDGLPELDWKGDVIDAGKHYDGVRLPATPRQLQQIADHLDAMLMTPVIIEELWLQADLRIDAIVNAGPPAFTIVAELGVTRVHQLIEAAIAKKGGQKPGQLVDSVGKHWCLINQLLDAAQLLYGDETACNFGWCSTTGSGLGVTPRVRCWQRPGYKHNLDQIDPSQTIRLMSKHARLTRADGSQEQVHLYDVAKHPDLAPLIHHDKGLLRCLRQPSVPVVPIGGTVSLPDVIVDIEGPSA